MLCNTSGRCAKLCKAVVVSVTDSWRAVAADDCCCGCLLLLIAVVATVAADLIPRSLFRPWVFSMNGTVILSIVINILIHVSSDLVEHCCFLSLVEISSLFCFCVFVKFWPCWMFVESCWMLSNFAGVCSVLILLRFEWVSLHFAWVLWTFDLVEVCGILLWLKSVAFWVGWSLWHVALVEVCACGSQVETAIFVRLKTQNGTLWAKYEFNDILYR